MSEQPIFHVEEITVPDNQIWPTDFDQMVTRYALVDNTGVWWINGHQFGLLSSLKFDRSSSDVRDYLRKSTYDALKDVAQWYDWEMGDDGHYHQVIYGR